jgi:hypothetical protein
MKIIQVIDRQTEKHFYDCAREIYKNDPNWVCPPDSLISGIFNPQKNRYFDQGDAARWVLTDQHDHVIGRVAAFYNCEKAEKYNPPVGGMGFFECIDNSEAAFMLFNTCREWLENKGFGAMDGPVNFGENDSYWGLLVEGFTQPAFGMNYNPPYYKKLFQEYGFKPFFEQESKHLDLRKPFPDRFWKIAEWVMRKPGYSFKHIRKKEIDKFAADVVEIYNSAWTYHEHFSPLTVAKVKKSFEEAKPVLIEEFIWFAYFEGKPIAFLVMLPDMNQVFKLFNGRLNLWNQLRFLMLRRSKMVTRARITILGVVPKFQGIGVESAIFWHLQKPVLKKRTHYCEIEISWVGDFNPKMKATIEAMGANPGKTHITYRKLFNQDEQFKPATKVDEIRKKI